MPIYEYKCNDCGITCEILHKSTTTTNAECPECKSGNLEKLISAPGAVRSKSSTLPDTPPTCPKSHQCGMPSCPAHSHNSL